ncbi:FAD binding domain-containing protein [Fusarium denticulatum]|uniref:FAD binding domain-containing protein n=1 Tax=Fusarium denticulatum TaxID=48507 RepID=A0A8H5SUU1_9HYPO|nr:FAD binding domain-containing protein [Fusarium denticulatum]
MPYRFLLPLSGGYNRSVLSYYSGQERGLRPCCVFAPTRSSEVARFVREVTKNGSSRSPKFAIHSGGHTIWGGAANIAGGITVDMRAMNEVELSLDRKPAKIGTGGIWSDIYTVLVPHNLTVMGGRVAGIGVGGLFTGGGINYLSRRYGWVCDNIYAYEIVLGNGDVVVATADLYADLWLALKGGSNNFGIVLSLHVPTWLMKLMWRGSLTVPYITEVLLGSAKAFAEFMALTNFDNSADMGLAFVFEADNPPVYLSFLSIIGRISSNTGLQNVANITKETNGSLPEGSLRAIDLVYSFRNADVAGLQLVYLLQPHPVTNGTNSLGLEPGGCEFVMAVLTAAYSDREDDGMVQKTVQAIMNNHIHVLQEKGLYISYKYLNYADKSQDPIASYGKTKRRLQSVSRKYDHQGVFQKRVPGGFKLF